MNTFTMILGIVVILVGVFLSDTFFTIHETEQALILQFGEPKDIIQTPGLKLKIPFVQNVIRLDRRVLDVDPPIEQVILADQKRLDVDAFMRYRIVDPLQFYQSVGSETIVEQRLSSVINSSLRRILGNVTLLDILSQERAQVMLQIREQVDREASGFGVEVVDVRIRRADFPEATSQAIFARMRSEREREAAEARAQGQEESQRIKASADRERTVLLAEAQREAQKFRGQGDNEALRIIVEATGQDPEFFAFYRSLGAYRNTITNTDTKFILSPTGDFFQFFTSILKQPPTTPPLTP